MSRLPQIVCCAIAALAFSSAVQSAPPTAKTPVDQISGRSSSHWVAEKPIDNGAGPVTNKLLRSAAKDSKNWLHYGGDYRNFRHSPLKSITPESVKNIKVAWTMATGTTGQMGNSPVVYDGVMYVTSSWNRLFAMDAKTGEILWRYDHTQPKDLRICCGPANRGVAIQGDLVLMGTLDARLIAFNRKTGEIVWNTEIIDYRDGFSVTSAPLIVDGLAYIGIGGGEFGVRAFFDAYNVKTGEHVWRHYTVPTKGEPGAETWAGDSYKTGGAPTWTTGTYDVETDTLFWTTGNPSPDWNGDVREGDNLYSDSILAVDPKTGERKWYFQFTPHDVWDYDGNSHLFMVDLMVDGKKVKAVAQPNRNGYLYILDRTNGKFLRATQYVENLNWATIDENGRPVVDMTKVPVDKPSERVCPGTLGGMNGSWTGSYDPTLGLAFVPTAESCVMYKKGFVAFIKGVPFMGGHPIPYDALKGKAYGHISAIDLSTGKIAWRYMDANPMMAGAMSTAGGVLFSGNVDGFALAIDSKTGKELWRFRTGSGVRSQPIAYEVDGEAYIAIGSGHYSSFTAIVGGKASLPEGGHLFVFKIPKS